MRKTACLPETHHRGFPVVYESISMKHRSSSSVRSSNYSALWFGLDRSRPGSPPIQLITLYHSMNESNIYRLPNGVKALFLFTNRTFYKYLNIKKMTQIQLFLHLFLDNVQINTQMFDDRQMIVDNVQFMSGFFSKYLIGI